MKSPIRRLGLLAVAFSVMIGCSSESTTAPASPGAAPAAPSKDLLSSLLSLLSVNGLQRKVPLASPITVSQTIDGAGGTLSIPAAGVSVTVPQGALLGPTVITMTARAGSLVAYDFAPHGIVFAKPLSFKQSLNGTNASLLTAPFLELAYYNDPNLLTGVGGLVSQLLGGTVDLLTWTFHGSIPHFSGYMIACGRSGGE